MLNCDRPRLVIGPGDKPLTLSDLPSPNTHRWVTRRKAEVVAAVHGGLLSRKEAQIRYSLSGEELESWENLYCRHGVEGLRTTRVQQYR